MRSMPVRFIVSARMARRNPASEPIEPLFPKLVGQMTPDKVARHQKARLEGAMVEAVARHGFAGTTLRELVGLAGVSKSTFYDHFESKQDCFLATFDTIIAEVSARVEAAYREEGDIRERLVAAVRTFMEVVVSEPAAARLAAIESLTLGAAGVAHRERGMEAFETMLGQSFQHPSAPNTVQPRTVRAIAVGIRGVVYRHLRAGKAEELPRLDEMLVDWALGYQKPESDTVKRAALAAAEPRPEAAAGTGTQLDWNEPPDSKRSRSELSQRERIVRAAGLLVVEKGFDTLSIPAISARAGTSNQTFYEHFSSKRDAFLAAFDVTAAEGLYSVSQAFESAGPGPEAIGAGLRAMLEHVAGNELFSRITFFDLQTAGPVALDRADAVMDTFTAFLQPGVAPAGVGTVPLPIVQAIGSGSWSVIQHELAHGRTESLPELGPELTRLVLMPFAPD
jgi:AcrR family transcriptional regulator